MTMIIKCVGLVMIMFISIQHTAAFFYQTTPETNDVCRLGLSINRFNNLTTTMSNMNSFYRDILAKILVPRVPDTPSHAIVRQFIESKMQSLGWTIEEDQFTSLTPHGRKTFTNVIATLDPAATKRIVFACHYDSKYMRHAPNFTAATDSAVPCSLLIDTAVKLNYFLQQFKNNNLQDVTPQFIFFDGEEAFVRWTEDDSLYGSRHLATKWYNQPDPNDSAALNNLKNIEMFVLLDLIGAPNLRFSDFFQNTSRNFYDLYFIEYCLEVKRVLSSRAYKRPMFNPSYRSNSVIEDDYIPFIRKGVPVLHLISTPFPSVWHTARDDLAHLDATVIAEFATIFRVFFFNLFQL